MVELLQTVASWPTLLLVVVVFGFAPGFCLRLIVLAYPRSDPRRSELIAELYAVPRIQRPLWVAEQLEVALFEGLSHRLRAALRQLARRRRSPAERMLLLAQAVSQLPDRDRVVFTLYYFENLTFNEIGAVLGITESSARRLRAFAVLRVRSKTSGRPLSGLPRHGRPPRPSARRRRGPP